MGIMPKFCKKYTKKRFSGALLGFFIEKYGFEPYSHRCPQRYRATIPPDTLGTTNTGVSDIPREVVSIYTVKFKPKRAAFLTKGRYFHPRPPIFNVEPPVSGGKPPISEKKPPVSGLEPAVSEKKPPVSGLEPAVFDEKPPVFGPKPLDFVGRPPLKAAKSG